MNGIEDEAETVVGDVVIRDGRPVSSLVPQSLPPGRPRLKDRRGGDPFQRVRIIVPGQCSGTIGFKLGSAAKTAAGATRLVRLWHLDREGRCWGFACWTLRRPEDIEAAIHRHSDFRSVRVTKVV